MLSISCAAAGACLPISARPVLHPTALHCTALTPYAPLLRLCALPRPCLQASVAYYLMADNRRRMPSSAYLNEEMTEATDAHTQYPSGGWAAQAGTVV